MTMGPDPISRIVSRSSRLGMVSHGGDELVEVMPRIVRPRRRLGVVLDGEQRALDVAESLYGSVVEVDVRDLELRHSGHPAAAPTPLLAHGEAVGVAGGVALGG